MLPPQWKVGGLDGLAPYLIVKGGERMVVPVGSASGDMGSETVPEQWKESLVGPAFKDGASCACL